MLVGLGQTVCLPVGRKCGECDLGLKGLCKSAERKKVLQGKRVKKEDEEVLVGEDGAAVVKLEQVKTEVVIKEEAVNEKSAIGDALLSSGTGEARSRKRRASRPTT